MKLGISIYSIPNNKIKDLVEFSLANEFYYIELWDDKELSDNIKYLSNLGKKLSISVHAIPDLNLGVKYLFDDNYQSISELVKKARLINTNNITLHIGEGGNTETAYKFLNIIASEFSDINFNIENVGYLSNETIKGCEELTNFINNFGHSNIGFVFDVAHAAINNEIECLLKGVNRKPKYLHVSDNKQEMNNHHLPIGKGNINFSYFKDILKNIPVILEIKPDINWKENLIISKKTLEYTIH